MLYSQALCLENIYLVDSSWTSTSIFSFYRSVWKDFFWQNRIYVYQISMTKIICFAFRNKTIKRDNRKKMLNHSTWQNFGTNCKDLIAMLRILRLGWHYQQVERNNNAWRIVDLLPKTVRFIIRIFCFIGYSILIWFLKLFFIWIIEWFFVYIYIYMYGKKYL